MFRLFAGILEHAPRAAEHLLLAFMAWSEAKPGSVAAGPAVGTPVAEGAAAGAPGAGGARGPLARAQRGPVIISADAGKRRIRPGESFELSLTLEIETGWHVQSAKPSREDRVPTSVELGLAEGLTPGEMRFPDGSMAPLGGESLPVYVGRVTIRVPIQAEPDAPRGKAPIVARVRFQPCDDKHCLAPEQMELSFSVEVV
jgi:DsbC/DsbD-like thiol-disulfide interchange protein